MEESGRASCFVFQMMDSEEPQGLCKAELGADLLVEPDCLHTHALVHLYLKIFVDLICLSYYRRRTQKSPGDYVKPNLRVELAVGGIM